MRLQRNRAVAISTTVAAIAALTAGTVWAAPAQATTTDLNLPGYGDLVVDERHDRLFISGGPSSNGVVVTDLDGHVEKTITGQYGATGLALSADSKQLYVALAGGDAISVIDTGKLKEIARHPTGARTCPSHLARTGSVLWFGHGCEGAWNGGVGRVVFPPPPSPSATPTASPSAPPAPEITLHTQGSVRFQRAPLLAGHDDEAGPLVAAQLNLSLSAVYVYDVGATHDLTTRTSATAPGSNLHDIGLDKYGETLLTGAASRNATQAWATADLSGRGSYYTGYYPLAVAASPDDFHVANGVRATGDDIYVYETGGVVPERGIDITDDVLAPRGLTWSPDSETLYAVSVPPTGSAPTLHVIDNPTH